MVVNVQSDVMGVDDRVRLDEVDAPLPGTPFAEGWHPGETLDYTMAPLSVHVAAFTPHEVADLVRIVTGELDLDARVSVYTTSSGGSSAHLVHRNAPNADGAIVLRPDSANPHWLLFAFATQTF
jgi:hypothetical protein